MINESFKTTTKFKAYGKCDLLRKRLCAEEINFVQQKHTTRDYVNEIFAGLIWLG